jgi:hypothetical protein
VLRVRGRGCNAQPFVLRMGDMIRASLALALGSVLLIASAQGGCNGPGLEPPSPSLASVPKSGTPGTRTESGDGATAVAPSPSPVTPAPAAMTPAGIGGECVPDSGLRSCGSDGCGGSCGTCAGGLVCGADGQCGCTSDCDASECADDAGCADE